MSRKIEIFVLFILTKIHLHESIYRTEFSSLVKVSGKSVANSRKYEHPNLSMFTNECMPGGKLFLRDDGNKFKMVTV